jgi:hypothetical protein
MDWDRVNIWTSTLYALIQSLQLAKEQEFGDLDRIASNIAEAGAWISSDCSYNSVLSSSPFGKARVTFRRNPNKHFEQIVQQVIKMLVQDLTVILVEMMTDLLNDFGDKAGSHPQSKIQKLKKRLDKRHEWSVHGCLELVAVRNALTHNGGRWNEKSIDIVRSFVIPEPKIGDKITIGFSMLFRYRKAMRTFLNEVALGIRV